MKFLLMMVVTIFSLGVVSAQTKQSTKTTKAQTTKKKTNNKKSKNLMHYQCPMKCEGDKTYHKDGKCPVCKMQLKKVKAEVAHAKFQCPMKCEGDKTYAKEGKCPVCNMNLKHSMAKKTDNSHEGHGHN
jgi:transcription initiation factor IIE alpha subunit